MLVRTETKVLDGFTGVLGSTEEESNQCYFMCILNLEQSFNVRVGTSWASLCELIKGDALTAGSSNASTGSGGEPQGSDAELGHFEEAVVISYRCNNDNSLSLLLLGRTLVGSRGHNAGDRNRGSVDLAHVETAQDSGVELGVGTACKLLQSTLRHYLER